MDDRGTRALKLVLCTDSLSPQLTGIGRYCYELARRMPAHPEISEVVFQRAGYRVADPEKLIHGGHTNPVPRVFRPFAKRIFRHGIRRHLFHGPNFFLPEWVDGGVLTVHDLSVLYFPDAHPVERVRQFERQFSGSVARAAHIITDTRTIRAEVISHFGLDPARVSAVPLGVDPRFRPDDGRERAVLTQFGLSHKQYGLCVATFEPRKRIVTAIDAWSRLPQRIRLAKPLVLAGASGWLNDSLDQRIRQAEREGWVRKLGFVPDALLPALYAGADIFLYPSVYEGFGLPPVEAMASGVPTIVADRSCLPEVTQGAAMTVDPDDPVALTNAIDRGLHDDLWRHQAIADGLRVAGSYQWSRCIAETVAVYRKILSV